MKLRSAVHTLLLPVLLCCLVPCSSAEPRDELIAERSLYTKTFANTDGSTTYQLGSAPIHFQSPDGSGEWLDVNTVLEPVAGQAAPGWANHSSNIPVHLPEVLGEGEPIAFGPDLGIRWMPGLLRVRLFSGEELELAPPQPSSGSPVEGRDDAVLYADLFPGFDLRVELGSGGLLLTTLLKEFPYDVERREIEALILDAGIEVEPHLLQAMEDHLAAGPDSDAPLHFGSGDDEYVITLGESPGAAMPDPDAEPVHRIADFLADRRVEHVFRHELLVESRRQPEGGASTTTAALTAVLGFKSRAEIYEFHPVGMPDAKADVVNLYSHRCSQGVMIRGTGAAAGFPAEVYLSPDFAYASLGSSLTAPGFGVRRDPMPAGVPEPQPIVTCIGDRDLSPRFSLAVASFAGLKALRDKLQPAAGGKPVVNLQLGYKPRAKNPTSVENLFHVFPRRVPSQVLPATRSVSSRASWDRAAVDAIFDAPEYALDWDLFTRSNGGLRPVANPADCGTRIRCETALAGAWGRHTSTRHGFTFGPLNQPAARDDLAAALRAQADYFHVALTAGVNYGAEPVYAVLADLRLEITTRDVVVPTAEIEVSDPLDAAGNPDSDLPVVLYPGETIRLAVDLTKLENAAEVTFQTDELELFRDYGLQVWWQRTVSGSSPLSRATLKKRPPSPPPGFNEDRAILTVSWTNPGRRAYWSDPARRKTAMVRLRASFPGAQHVSEAQSVSIRLEDFDGQIDLRSTPRSQEVPVNAQIAGPNTLAIKSGSLVGATGMRLRVAYMWAPGARRVEPVPARVYELSNPGVLTGADETTLSFLPVQLAADYGLGTYMFVIEPCFSSSRLGSRYEVCREDRQERLVLEILGDPKIDFIFPSSTTQPQGASRRFSFAVHGSELGDANVSRVKMSGRTVTAQPVILSGSSTQLDVRSRLLGTVACGPHLLTVSRFSAAESIWRVASHIVNVHRGAVDSMVFEAETGEVEGAFFKDATPQVTPGRVPSNGQMVTVPPNRTAGSVSWQFQVPSRNVGYRFFLRAKAVPGSGSVGGTARLEERDAAAPGGWKQVRTFDWTLTDGRTYDARLVNLAGADTFDLRDGTTYRLTVGHRANHRFPQIDMVVIALTQTPDESDLCFGP